MQKINITFTHKDPVERKRFAEAAARSELLYSYYNFPRIWKWVPTQYSDPDKVKEIINVHMPKYPTRELWCQDHWGTAEEAQFVQGSLSFNDDEVHFQVEIDEGTLDPWVKYLANKGYNIQAVFS